LIALAVVAWINRPLPPPRILSTTQLTHDGVSKDGFFTDGSRIYINEIIGPKHYLLQGSTAGGETSPIPNPFLNPRLADVSPDKSQLLVFELSSRNTGDKPAGYCLCPLEALTVSVTLRLTTVIGLRMVSRSYCVTTRASGSSTPTD
jgi:hypothetical protein